MFRSKLKILNLNDPIHFIINLGFDTLMETHCVIFMNVGDS